MSISTLSVLQWENLVNTISRKLHDLFPTIELTSFLSIYPLRFESSQEWLELESWNFVYSISMKNV